MRARKKLSIHCEGKNSKINVQKHLPYGVLRNLTNGGEKKRNPLIVLSRKMRETVCSSSRIFRVFLLLSQFSRLVVVVVGTT